MNQRLKSSANFFEMIAKLPNKIMASEDLSTSLLQFLFSLLTKIIKDSCQHISEKMGQFPYQKKRMVAAVMVQKWGVRIWVMGGYVCISLK